MYRPPSYREFKKFVGELTGEASACHVALLYLSKLAEPFEWTVKAREQGIKLDGIENDVILKSQVKLSIVSLYSGFDIFIQKITTESKEFGLAWIKKEKVSPLVKVSANFTAVPKNKTELRQLHDCIDYYRLLRNYIVHPSDGNKDDVCEFYEAKKQSIDSVREKYNSSGAPSHPDLVSFYDVKFLCRILLDASEEIAQLLKPTEEQLYKVIPFEQWSKFKGNEKSTKRAATNYLITEYGLVEAKELVDRMYK